jgi:Zn-dependent peptidase ImmA (M78 family)/DNA-binding XRE family transcriptional regulator
MRTGILGFVPLRLTQAREARGLSITELAELTGVSRQSISNYENSKQAPGHAILNRIAEKLKLPIRFFLKPCQRRDNKIFFRALSAATQQARVMAGRRTEWLQDIIDYLGEMIEFLPENVPNYDIGNNPLILTNNDIENITSECRQKWGLKDGPISNVVLLFENNGIIITRLKLYTTVMDSFSVWYEDYNLPIIILGDDKRIAVRSRFDAAHELGHLILHRSVDRFGGFYKEGYFAEMEKQAHRFSSAFLLPAQSFTSDFGYPSLDAFWALKTKWKVSIKAMIKRCHDLNIIDDDYAKKLYIGYNRRGWNKGEPFDDEWHPEEPVFSRRCVELIVKDKVQTREGILSDLHFSDVDIEELASLERGYLTRKSIIEPSPQLKNQKNSISPHGGPGTVIPFSRKKE